MKKKVTLSKFTIEHKHHVRFLKPIPVLDMRSDLSHLVPLFSQLRRDYPKYRLHPQFYTLARKNHDDIADRSCVKSYEVLQVHDRDERILWRAWKRESAGSSPGIIEPTRRSKQYDDGQPECLGISCEAYCQPG